MAQSLNLTPASLALFRASRRSCVDDVFTVVCPVGTSFFAAGLLRGELVAEVARFGATGTIDLRIEFSEPKRAHGIAA